MPFIAHSQNGQRKTKKQMGHDAKVLGDNNIINVIIGARRKKRWSQQNIDDANAAMGITMSLFSSSC